MDDFGTWYLLNQLWYLGPELVACLVAFALALVFRRRCPGPSTLALLGVGVLFLSTIAAVAAQAYLIQGGGISHHLVAGTALAGNCARGAGLLLLVTAIFAGRVRAERRDDQLEAPPLIVGVTRAAGGESGLSRDGRGR